MTRARDHWWRRLSQPWWRRREPPRIVVEADGVSISGPAARQRVSFEPDSPPEQAIQQALQQTAPRRVELAVESAHVVFAALTWSPALTGPRRWHALARERLRLSANVDHGDDKVREASFHEPRIASALPPKNRLAVALSTDLLRVLAAARRGRLLCIRVALLERLNALLADEPAFTGCVVDVGASQAWILVFRDGEVLRVRRRRLTPGQTDDEVAAAVLPTVAAEWAALFEKPLRLAVCGPRAAALAPSGGRTAEAPPIVALTRRRARGTFNIDFARRAAGPSATGWFLLGAGVAAALLALIPLHGEVTQRSALMASVDRLESAVARALPSGTGPGARSVRPGTADADLVRVSADLNRPWRALFEGIEGAKRPTVHVQQIAVDRQFTQMQLVLDAKSLPELMAFSDALGAQAAIGTVQLVQHEWRTVSGARVLTARLNAALRQSPVAEAASKQPLQQTVPVADARSEAQR